MREQKAMMLADDLLEGVTDMRFGEVGLSVEEANEVTGKVVTLHRRLYER